MSVVRVKGVKGYLHLEYTLIIPHSRFSAIIQNAQNAYKHNFKFSKWK
jgi:hypothetical protein